MDQINEDPEQIKLNEMKKNEKLKRSMQILPYLLVMNFGQIKWKIYFVQQIYGTLFKKILLIPVRREELHYHYILLCQ